MQTDREIPHIGDEAASFVVVANRLPVDATVEDDGSVVWSEAPGGLVSALAPVLRGREAAWIGWSGLATDIAVDGAVIVPPAMVGSYHLVDVPLSAQMVEEYYEGFANSTLWPLYHDRIVAPEYHRETWNSYVDANLQFAEHAAAVAAHGATVWVHDYQLQLVPSMLRSLRPDLRIGYYLHIPFPPAELFLQLPWRQRIIEGMLGADLVGFQTHFGAGNFCEVAGQLLDVETHFDRERGGWVETDDGRRVRVDAFPISIDVASYAALAATPQVQQRAREIRSELGDPKFLLLGVDRMDYTKGIDVRLRAFVELLEDRMLDPGTVVLMQIATPSREQVEEYQRLREDVELLVGRAAGVHGDLGEMPLRYMYSGLPREELVAFYVAADVMLVTPFRDGMNLVAKEYIACQIDDDGSLVLSEFAGAALEFPQAWLVNPFSQESVKEAIMTAIGTTDADRRRRMAAMRAHLARHDVARWASEFLDALAAV